MKKLLRRFYLRHWKQDLQTRVSTTCAHTYEVISQCYQCVIDVINVMLSVIIVLSELLTATKRAMRADVERKTKFGKATARVNEVEADTCLRNGSSHLLQQQAQLLQKQMDELLDIRADVAELKSLNNNSNQKNCDKTDVLACECAVPKRVIYGCQACKATGNGRNCTHCFKCGKGDHKAFQCPTRIPPSSNSQGSL